MNKGAGLPVAGICQPIPAIPFGHSGWGGTGRIDPNQLRRFRFDLPGFLGWLSARIKEVNDLSSQVGVKPILRKSAGDLWGLNRDLDSCE